jgi:hypothetical protein
MFAFIFPFVQITRMIQRDIINYIRRHVKEPPIVSDFNETWLFLTEFRKLLKYKILRKYVHWEPSCSLRTNRHTDGRTDTTELIVAFHNNANNQQEKVLCGPKRALVHEETKTLPTGNVKCLLQPAASQ